jgi:hypothetical protein
MLTGMGNGSVFGAAVMCFVGRGPFEDWGGQGSLSYIPTTFNGFMSWSMLVFGFAFVAMLFASLSRHDALEQQAG